jgi:hypothetical protein
MAKALALLAIAAALTVGVAVAGTSLAPDEGSVVCVSNNASGVNGRFVASPADCKPGETARFLLGPNGTVANATHADEADHAADADSLGGRDASEYMHGYLRETNTFTASPGGFVIWTSNCSVGKVSLSFGVDVTNLGALSPRPTIFTDGQIDVRNWRIGIQNNDPDTAMQTFAHSQCFDDPDAVATAAAKASAGPSGPVAQSE